MEETDLKRLQIYVFGASIVYGAWDSEGGWVTRLRKHLDATNIHLPSSLRPQVFNLGVSAQTSNQLLARIEAEFKARYRDDADHRVLISIGANDCAFMTHSNSFVVSQEAYEQNLVQMIQVLQAFSPKTMLLTLLPVNEQITEKPNHKGRIRKNEFIEQYNDRTKKVAKQYGLEMIDIYTHFIEQKYADLLTDDGVHPNDQGHEVLYGLVKNKLEQKGEL